jgi:hypothetical protein
MMPKHYNGHQIVHYTFFDVKSGDKVTLGECVKNEAVGELLGGYYYADITQATENNDIIWQITSDKIKVPTKTLEEVQSAYQRGLTSLAELNHFVFGV